VDPTIELEMRCDGERMTRRYTLFPVRIGRERDCELYLPHGFISRHHARIERIGDDLVLVDEGSRNGVICDGRKLSPHEPARLVDGSEIRIKRFEAVIRIRARTEFANSEVIEGEKATSLYADREINPEIIDHVSAAIDQCPAARIATPSTVAHSLSVVGNRHVAHSIRGTAFAPGVRDSAVVREGEPDASPIAIAPYAIPLFELCEVATRHLPAGPAMTSPNLDALLDGLPGYGPVEMPADVEPAVEVPCQPALVTPPAAEELNLDDTIDWRPPEPLLVRATKGIRRAVLWLVGALMHCVPRVGFCTVLRTRPRALRTSSDRTGPR
jgi:predicted component of type VI protein secretion system